MTVGFGQSYGLEQYQHRVINSGHISDATQNWGIAGLATNTLGALVGGEEGRTLNTLGNLFGGIADIRAQHEVNRYEETSYRNVQQNSNWGGTEIMPWGALPQQQFVQPYQQQNAPAPYPQCYNPKIQNNQQQGMMQMMMGMMMMMLQMMMQMFGMGGQQNNQGSFAFASSGNNGSVAYASSGNNGNYGNYGYNQPMNYDPQMPLMTNGYQSGNYQNYQYRDVTSGHISEATQNWGIAGLAANTLGSLVGGKEGNALGELGNLFGGIANIRAMGEVNTMHEERFSAGNFLNIF